jgi:4-amino-4-deoxy-L-arabinose transferase-like glycosyltransferase
LSGLWLLAILVALAGLGHLPLRDWDESLVARVALEASEKPWPDLLLPTYWGKPYLNKPPGLHLLIAGAIQLWRASTGSAPGSLPPEWLLRLIPALLSSTVVPMVGLVQARLRPAQHAVAVASSAMALTLLPLARHGRLVMLDGCQLAAILLIWWAVLTPDHRRRSLLIYGGLMGMGASALLLLKAPLALPLLLATMVLRALDRELKRAQWLWLLGGLALGLLPGLAWHGAHAFLRGSDALDMWLGQGFARVHEVIEGNSGGIWMPITEVLEGGWPWLALWPGAMALAWRERRTRAGRWCLGTTAISALLVLPLRTQLPWYSQLFWPPLVLCCGPLLAWLVDPLTSQPPPWAALIRRVPAFWALLGGLLCGLALVAMVFHLPDGPALAPVAGAGGLGLLVGGTLLLARPLRRRQTGVILLVCGLWGALLLLMQSPLWLWELNERWPVHPVAEAVLQHPDASVHLLELEERPSLNWYAGRRVRPIRSDALRERKQPTLLISIHPEPPKAAEGTCTSLPLALEAGSAPHPVHVFACKASR